VSTLPREDLLSVATARIRALQDELEDLRAGQDPRVAVVGTGVRLPGCAPGADGFWAALTEGRDCVRDSPASSTDLRPPVRLPAGLLDRVDLFDADFFGLSTSEAVSTDPQQRLALEVAWEALEDAGQPVDAAHRSVGVFVGVYQSDYLSRVLADEPVTAFTGPGNAHSIIANRISYCLDLHGPSLAVDTACSSSLVAVHLAMRALRTGECDVALAGGVNLLLSERADQLTGAVLPVAPGGRCRSFDAAADGIVRSEGCGFVVLRRLRDAMADDDRIYAVIRGSAVNQDGRSNGLTAPNPLAQQAVVERALADAGMTAGDVEYVEAHGTGTALGDPIEVDALAATYGAGGGTPCYVGSVKSNLGHTEAAAGIAGLIKAALCLHRARLVPTVHLRRPNPLLRLEGTRLRLADGSAAWPDRFRGLRAAAVSSFGFGGTNAHLVLEEAPERVPRAAPAGPHVLPVSGRSATSTSALVVAYEQALAAAVDPDHAAALVRAAATRRAHHEYRVAFVANDVGEMRAAGLSRRPIMRSVAGRVAFVFSGQGAQWAGMGERLCHEAVFADVVHRCDEHLAEYDDWRIWDLLHGQAGDGLDRTDRAQLALFAVEIGIAETLAAWGIRPVAALGHSVGEVTAACVSGALDLAQCVRLLHERGRLMHAMAAGGSMLSVRADEGQLTDLIRDTSAVIASINGPRSMVVSGAAGDITAVADRCAAHGLAHTLLPVRYAFHSRLLDAAPDRLVSAVGELRPHDGEVATYSTLTGGRVRGSDFTTAHFAAGVRARVRLAPALRALAAEGVDLIVEIGPRPTLLADIVETLADLAAPPRVIGSLSVQAPGLDGLAPVVAAAYEHGVDVDWVAFHGGKGPHVPLPPYPWQHRSYWPSSKPATGYIAAIPDARTTDDPADVLEFLRTELALMIGEDPVDVDVDLPVAVYAVDSLMVVELKNKVERRFGMPVPLSVLLSDASVTDVVRRMVV